MIFQGAGDITRVKLVKIVTIFMPKTVFISLKNEWKAVGQALFVNTLISEETVDM